MGAWGPAIYSDDLACDIRDDFKELIGDGLDSEQATSELIKEYQDSINDSDENSVFWFALADTQWKTGRLINRVLDKTLEIIESGSDLERWKEDPKVLKKREYVITKLKQQLLTEQPKQKRIPKVYKEESTFNIGDIFSYQNKLENKALFRVIGIHQDSGGRFSVCELLDWFEKELPIKNGLFSKGKIDSAKLSKLRIRSIDNDKTQFMLGETVAKYKPKDDWFELIKTKSKPHQKCAGYSIIFWRNLDELLTNEFEK
ncbi:hypothetical protein [Mangrovimonas sp. YM274]|uniref:hypothetical protein n=1 Tax=Mangrovimonas sp. YM274 TaxID=3070660 RepID=UPI0027DE9503|nr:hypothetical protein [Mangrovimonas sp. YM274]WMI68176.1 hypothetical protein RBH95_13605 [Mangrovimonas sp. YM274]